MSNALKYISSPCLENLFRDIPTNRDRYISGNFLDLAAENGWEIESTLVKVDFSALSNLDGTDVSGGRRRTAEPDAKNAAVIYKALEGMTPALAVEERIWARLTHIECLEYTRSRWLYTEKIKSLSEEEIDKQIRLHFFASTLTGIRDDNALSRLWWSMHIATMCTPKVPREDFESESDWKLKFEKESEKTLALMFKNADIRSNLIERSWTGARIPLSRAIVDLIAKEAWLTDQQENFREFMKVLNMDGGGILFESYPASEIEQRVGSFVHSCLKKAQESLSYES